MAALSGLLVVSVAASSPSETATAVAAGGFHSCAVTSAGGAKCWGYNQAGELGDGTTSNRQTPVDVSGLTSGIAAVTAGFDHTCALASVGGVKCWGDNVFGQLGDGTTTARLTPVDVSGLTSDVAAVAAGNSHTCAVTTSGGAKCWGNNGSGQLGGCGSAACSTPVDVTGLTSGVAAITAGFAHTCALTSGGVKCWGLNNHGQLGDGTTNDSSTPVDVSGLPSGVQAIAAGDYHTCALTSTGGVECWGSNQYGQLGDGTETDRPTPVDVSGLASEVGKVAAGGFHTCALTKAGGMKCWGSNGGGELGDGTTSDSTIPVDVSGLASGVAAIADGYFHTCATTTAGAAMCWGSNDDGQLGDGTTTNRLAPVEVIGFEGPRTLDVKKAGAGAGAVTSNPVNIDCGSTCSHDFAYGTHVTLTATPAAGSRFARWSGDCAGTGTCTLTLDANRSVTATFALPPKCRVPKVVGLTIKIAKGRILKARCRVGKITYKHSASKKNGRVLAQSPKPGKKLLNGAKVRLIVGKG
ncbi:MAG TPA: PASTA domain-containing protein [Gaiellaceae bacterium]|nr:PASTA domain-containing protein [Gaiellaceae bacterium]